MFCKNCGKQIEDNSKFCTECGAATTDFGEIAKKASEYSGMNVEYEVVQEKKWDSPEKVLSAIAVLVVLYSVAGPILGSLFFGWSGGLPNILRGIVIAGVLFGITMFIHSKRPLTDHYKFKCPYCNEEDTVAADENHTFKCSKCKKTMTIVDGKIKTID